MVILRVWAAGETKKWPYYNRAMRNSLWTSLGFITKSLEPQLPAVKPVMRNGMACLYLDRWTQTRGSNPARDRHITCLKNAKTGEWSPLGEYSKLKSWSMLNQCWELPPWYKRGYSISLPSKAVWDIPFPTVTFAQFRCRISSQEDLGVSSIPKGSYSFSLNRKKCLSQTLPICPRVS